MKDQIQNFNLRGISLHVMSTLKNEASRQETSVNSLILKILENSLGHTRKIAPTTYDDLDHLAGTWTKSDLKHFEKSTAFFEEVDQDIWK